MLDYDIFIHCKVKGPYSDKTCNLNVTFKQRMSNPRFKAKFDSEYICSSMQHSEFGNSIVHVIVRVYK